MIISMRRLILPLILLFVVSGCDPIKETSKTTACKQWNNPDLEAPFKRLQKSQDFLIGRIGINGAVPREEISLCKLIRSDNASAVLKELYSTGTPSGKLYALLGLRFVNKSKYKELLPHIKKQNGVVETQAGCIVLHSTIQNIASSIETGDYDYYINQELKAE